MKSRGTVGALATLVLAMGLVACVPQPEPTPTPTPTGFASEAEAFAAAEETYRAYVDALNQVDLSDPDTFEAVYAWTTGEANANEREALSRMHAEEWTVSGETVTEQFLPRSYGPAEAVVVTAIACSNVAGVAVVDNSGNSMVDPARRNIYALELGFVHANESPTLLRIVSSTGVEDSRCAT